MKTHKNFILTPISTILEEAVIATKNCGNGIETYPLYEYILQSVFLKMTGFQEQKVKCIAWEMATNDFDYRIKFLNNINSLGECSTYDSKNKIFKELFNQTKKFNSEYCIENKEVKSEIIKFSTNSIENIFKNSNIAIYAQKYFNYFCSKKNEIIKDEYLLPKESSDNKDNNKTNKKGKSTNKNEINLFENVLQDNYKFLYDQRNRFAHNTLSYQENLPTLDSLLKEDNENRNYFVWFALLIVIDTVFVELYKNYQYAIEDMII